MVFSSQIFIFTFLPAFLLVYYLLPFRFRSGLIVLASWVFYGWWRADFLFLLIGLTIWTYLCGKYTYAYSAAGQQAVARRIATVGIVGCLAVLGYFK
jgi:alginate O-acetyltransferase complex protein AlgI